MLFTDIEGSTRLLKRLGESYGELLADHRRLMREAFTAHGGHEIGTEGDSFFVTFARARDAVEAAVDGQRALARHAWPDGVECRVRMGMHTGEPSMGEVGYHGIGVHRGARVASAAHGGQVLLSSATAGLVQDDLPAGVSLLSLGEQQLKDIDRPEQLYQLVADGLLADFPPPRARAPASARAVPLSAATTSARCSTASSTRPEARAAGRSRSAARRASARARCSRTRSIAPTASSSCARRASRGRPSSRSRACSSSSARSSTGSASCRPTRRPRWAARSASHRARRPTGSTIGVATMALVALAAEDADLLLAVDDAQWLDSASSDALLFAARRFEADRVAVVLTVRDGGGVGFATGGLEELRLEGLGREASRRLAPHLTDRLYELTQGNPLALVELPSTLTEAQLEGAEPLNLGARVERAFRGRVQALSVPAQRALLLASANDSDRLDAVIAAGVDWRALGEAEDAGLVTFTRRGGLLPASARALGRLSLRGAVGAPGGPRGSRPGCRRRRAACVAPRLGGDRTRRGGGECARAGGGGRPGAQRLRRARRRPTSARRGCRRRRRPASAACSPRAMPPGTRGGRRGRSSSWTRRSRRAATTSCAASC